MVGPHLSLTQVLFGHVAFAEGEEYRKFQYRFTLAILLFATGITGLFHLAVLSGRTVFDPTYLQLSRAYLAVSIVFYLLLRGRPRWLAIIAVSYAALSWLLQVGTLLLNTPDELRVIWFALNLPGVYLVLGSGAGIFVTVLSVAFILFANAHLAIPYSVNALFTISLGIVYLSAFFHAFASRSISFHHAMVESNRRLAEMAARDPLTGLFNARAYYGLCDQALARARRGRRPFAMLFVDLDHFKSINDRHGHEAGDAVLRAVAACLADGVRHSDLVGRIGGEEFSALLPDTGREGALLLAEKLRAEIEALRPDIGAERLPVTASVGVAVGGPTSPSIAEVQRRADEAMYQAKRGGRNRVTCVEDKEGEAVRRSVEAVG